MTRRIEVGKDLGLISHGKEEGPCITNDRSELGLTSRSGRIPTQRHPGRGRGREGTAAE